MVVSPCGRIAWLLLYAYPDFHEAAIGKKDSTTYIAPCRRSRLDELQNILNGGLKMGSIPERRMCMICQILEANMKQTTVVAWSQMTVEPWNSLIFLHDSRASSFNSQNAEDPPRQVDTIDAYCTTVLRLTSSVRPLFAPTKAEAQYQVGAGV